MLATALFDVHPFGQRASAGGADTLAIRSDDTLWAWGNNGFGKLGDGTTTTRLAPVQVGAATWTSISASRLRSKTDC